LRLERSFSHGFSIPQAAEPNRKESKFERNRLVSTVIGWQAAVGERTFSGSPSFVSALACSESGG
jgi:hypothetical protein